MSRVQVQICDFCRHELREPKTPGHSDLPEGWSDFTMVTVDKYSDAQNKLSRTFREQEICKSCTDQIKLLIEQIKLHKG